MKLNAALISFALLACTLISSGCDRSKSSDGSNPGRDPSPSTTTTAANSDPDKVIGELGKPMRIGNIEWVVNSLDTAFEVTDGSSSEQAAGEFLMVKMTATALRDSATIDQAQLQILDGINRKFLPSAKIHASSKESLIPFPDDPDEPVFENIRLELKAGQSVTKYVLFDVPSDALGMKLVIRDELNPLKEAGKTLRRSDRRGVLDLMPLLQ